MIKLLLIHTATSNPYLYNLLFPNPDPYLTIFSKVATNLKTHSLKMPHFLILKDYKMLLFGFSR